MVVNVILAVVLSISLISCLPNQNTPQLIIQPTLLPIDEFIAIDQPIGFGYTSRYLEVYFTDPHHPSSGKRQDGLDRVLVSAINRARVSLDLAVYSLDDHAISYSIIRAKERGVSVRVVVEGDNIDSAAIQNLISNGVEVKPDGRSGLMHNKFMIIDGVEVWTGSMNYTYSSIYDDHNSLIRVISPEIAENYDAEFIELFGGKRSSATPFPNAKIGNFIVENYFSPDDHFAYRMVSLLKSTRNSVNFLMYTFTADDYSEILIDKSALGLDIQGVIEASAENAAGSDFEKMSMNGVNVKVVNESGLMHHKTIILDSEVVVLGSYNFTASAEKKNDENILVFWSPEIAQLFLIEYQRVLDQNPN